jgi:L-ascorbate metabolism protein UlaG (beta-lactamase superfamily)
MSFLQGVRGEHMRASRQFRDGHFHNTHDVSAGLQGNSVAVMREFFFGGKKRRPKIEIPVLDPREAWKTPAASGLRLTWFGHSTFLIEIDGKRVLTDPVLGSRASPVPFAGPKRFHPVPVTLADVPPLDAVLLTHDHHDHMEPASIRTLAKMRVPFVTSLGVGARLEKLGLLPELITELDWWEDYTTPDGVLTFTATPAQHFSGRGLRDRNRTLWSSFVLATAKRRIFTTGDTGLTDELREIGRRFGPFDVSLIEIGAADPAWEPIHLGPLKALDAFTMLGGGKFLPTHWATFDLALHAWEEPIETLVANAGDVRLLTPRVGEVIEPALVGAPMKSWWK